MKVRMAVLVAGWVVAAGAAVGWWKTYDRALVCEAEAVARPVAEVVARVNGREVVGEDLEFEALAAQAQAGIRYEGPEGERLLAEQRARLLEGLVDRALLEEEARRRGHRVDPGEVAEAEARLRTMVPEGSTLARLLEAGHFREALRRRASSGVLLEAFFADLRRQWVVTPQEVEAYYREHPAEFREGEAVFFRQIVVDEREVAEEVLRRARAGEEFRAIGEQVAPHRNGFDRAAAELRMFRGNPDPREPVLFGLKPGEVAGPVPTPVGHIVLRLERRVPAREVPFAEARERIERHLATRKQSEGFQKLVRELRAKATIERLLPAGPQPSPTPAAPASPGR
jgi:parvulin-like peptidyl-prolyl isomerase